MSTGVSPTYQQVAGDAAHRRQGFQYAFGVRLGMADIFVANHRAEPGFETQAHEFFFDARTGAVGDDAGNDSLLAERVQHPPGTRHQPRRLAPVMMLPAKVGLLPELSGKAERFVHAIPARGVDGPVLLVGECHTEIRHGLAKRPQAGGA